MEILQFKYVALTCTKLETIKVVVCAEILPKDIFQTLGNYYLSLTIAKIQRSKGLHR